MSANKPLAYDSLKIVMKYMEPDLRFELSQRIPSIRTTERITPLKLRRLVFEEFKTTVNETSYCISLYRKYPEGYPIPPEHRIDNRNGIDKDLTEHGFVISSTCHDLAPGDLRTTPPGGFVEEKEEILGDSQEELEYYERCVKIYEEALENRHRKNIACNGFQLKNPSSWIPRAGKDPLQNEATDRIIVRTLTQYSNENLESAIRICKAKLVPFYCRKDNSPLPFIPMLQITVNFPSGQKIYRFSYNMKLREAMKKLNTALFSGYKNTIQMRILCIYDYIIRLPVGLRMKIECLRMRGDIPSSYEMLRTVIDESSFPLYLLILEKEYFDTNQFLHPVVHNASNLSIAINDGMEGFMPILVNLPNKFVTFNWDENYPSVDLQIQFIQQWIEARKEVGTMISYTVREVYSVDELMHEIEQRQLGVVREKHLAYISIDDGRRLQITCKEGNYGSHLGLTLKSAVALKVVAKRQFL